jgi:hypothetical protein
MVAGHYPEEEEEEERVKKSNLSLQVPRINRRSTSVLSKSEDMRFIQATRNFILFFLVSH